MNTPQSPDTTVGALTGDVSADTIATNETIKWEGRDFYGGQEIGFTPDGGFVLHLYTTEPAEMRGTYFTSLPISPASYRKKHATKVAVRDRGDSISIYCDWGREHRLGAPRSILEKILAQAASHGVPVGAGEALGATA